MKVILSMAVSANGMIASKTGSEDFLSHANWIQFLRLTKKTGCFIWGRKTYEAVLKWEGNYLNDLEDIKKVIVSTSQINLKSGFTLANSPEHALKTLEEEGFKKAIITGGSTLNSEFAKKGLIDEVIFDVNPSILGEGIPVFKPSDFQIALKLQNVEKINDDIVELHYLVNK